MFDRITRRWLLTLPALALAGAFLAAPEAPAQKDKEEGKMTFEVYPDKKLEYRWRLKAANNKIMAVSSDSYKAASGAKDAIETIRTGLGKDKMTIEVYEDKGKEYRWRMKAANGRVMAISSEGYKAKSGAEAAMDRIKKGVSSAVVKEMKEK